MMVMGVDLNRWIFTYVLVLIFTFYFLITPIMYYKNKFPKTIVNRFSFLIPNYLYSSIFLITTLIINLNLAIWSFQSSDFIFSRCQNYLFAILMQMIKNVKKDILSACVEAISCILSIDRGLIPPTINHFNDDPRSRKRVMELSCHQYIKLLLIF